MLPKCDMCDKNITKRAVGLKCMQCDKVVHATTDCAGLTSKQLTAIRASDNIGWTCDDCQKISPPRKSFIIPDDEETEHRGNKNISHGVDIKKILRDMAIDIENSIKKELADFQESLTYCCDKIDTYEIEVKSLQTKVKEVEKKNVRLENQNKHLENEIGALKQRFNEQEQKQLANQVEITGMACDENENGLNIAVKIANMLNLKKDRITAAIRIPPKNDKDHERLMVTLMDEETASSWIEKSRYSRGTSEKNTASEQNIIVRRALTPYFKTLLWKAKSELKDDYRFIWCKQGKVFVRKTEKSKIFVIRSEEDIKNIRQEKRSSSQ